MMIITDKYFGSFEIPRMEAEQILTPYPDTGPGKEPNQILTKDPDPKDDSPSSPAQGPPNKTSR